jgi:transcriptional regulator with XRE-family HTH domain
MRTPTSRSLHGRQLPDAAPTLTDTTLGAAIRARRTALGLRQETVAARSGVDHNVLSRIERGERPCRMTEFVAIASALNNNPEALLKTAVGKGTGAAA